MISTNSSEHSLSLTNAKIFGHRVSKKSYVVYFVELSSGEVIELKEYEMDDDLYNKLTDYKTLISRVSYDGKSRVYEVKEIIAHRNDNGTIRYLVSWEGKKWEHPVWRCEIEESALKRANMDSHYNFLAANNQPSSHITLSPGDNFLSPEWPLRDDDNAFLGQLEGNGTADLAWNERLSRDVSSCSKE